MSIWTVPDTNFEPDIVLTKWSVYYVPHKDKSYFVGWNLWGKEGRVSSSILDFDSKACVGKTSSGRTYLLKGNSSACMDAEYVWQALLVRSGMTDLDYDEVSDKYSGL